MNQFVFIGLTGYAGCGKDTVRAILQEHFGYAGLAFADPIRVMVRGLLINSGISQRYIDDRALKEERIPELGVSYRQLAQTLGTEWGRSLQPDFWLRIASATVQDVTNTTFGPGRFVFSDVRFGNEADWIRRHGGVIWRIYRDAAERVRDHVSERSIDRIIFDHAINNNGTLADLHRNVTSAMEALPPPFVSHLTPKPEQTNGRYHFDRS